MTELIEGPPQRIAVFRALMVGDLLCAVPTSLYFLLFNGVAGRTPGRRFCRLPEPPPHVPLTLEAILRRSLTPASPLYDDEREPMYRSIG